MTGYTVHTGSTEAFSNGWDQIFQAGAKPKKAALARKAASKKAAVKKPTAKKAAKKKRG
jgi:hypothetical protein